MTQRSPSRPVVAIALLGVLASCSHAPVRPSSPATGATESTATGPTTILEVAGPAADAPPVRPSLFYPGSGKLVGTPPIHGAVRPPTGEGIQLQFVDTEIATVVGSVIGDGLGAPFLVDPAIKGPMTLQSTRPLSPSELVPALEAALQVHGYAIVNVEGTYHVVPMKEAARTVRGLRNEDSKSRPGFAIQIVSLKFVSATEMQKTLEPFAPPGGILRVDEGRNLLLLAGTSQEIATMQDVIQTFDVDWLAGMSFGMFDLKYVDAGTLANELKEVFADPRSPLNGVVRLVPIARMNALLVVTPQPRYLTDVQQWIQRLDLGGATPGKRIYVYDVQNAKAGDLARSLSRILGISAGDSAFDNGYGPGSAYTPGANPGGVGPGINGSFGQATLTAPGGNRPGGGFDRAAASQPSRGPVAFGGSTSGDASGLRIVPNDDNNSLLILASPSEFGLIESALKRLDVPPRQVLIEATLAEITLTKELKYGVQWSYLGPKGSATLSQSTTGKVAQAFPGFSYLYTGSTSIKAVLNAIESTTKVNILSNPKLMVLNNHEAQIQIGNQVPVTVQSAVSVGAAGSPIVNSVQLLDTGVILRVTPRVNQNGLVTLDITQEVSDAVKNTTSGIDSPTIEQRKLSSTVSVHSGDTIALGGLISEDVSKSNSGVPFLERIPLLGAAFRNTDNTKTRTELVILITPRVVRDDRELHQAMEDLRYEFRAIPGLAPGSTSP